MYSERVDLDHNGVEILKILGTIAGSGALSALVSGYVTHRLNVRKANQELLRGKLEELFTKVQTYGHYALKERRRWLFASIVNRQAPDESLKEAHRETTARCDLLISLYFPDLKPKWQTWMNSAIAMDQIESDFFGYAGDKEGVRYLEDRYQDYVGEFERYQHDGIEAALSEIAGSLIQSESVFKRARWSRPPNKSGQGLR